MTLDLKLWQARQQQQHAHRKSQVKKDDDRREWITIDGEGWGRDEHGRQYYRFMIAANESGFQMLAKPADSDRHALTTDEALSWLASIVPSYRIWCDKNNIEFHMPYIGGFALGYDYAHVLIDINAEQLESLMTNQDFESEPTQITEHMAAKITAGNFRVYTQTKPHLELARVWDTFRYYQAAFLKVMEAYATPEQWEIITKGKNRRNADADHDMNEEILYCLMECRVHSRAMNDLTRATHDMELKQSGWYGPGSLAAAAMRKHRTRDYWRPDSEQPPGLATAALHAYIGGRFETTGHGWVPRMYGHDIRSAYPAAMDRLPCLKHTIWKRNNLDQIPGQTSHDDGLYLVEWKASNPKGGWGPYPTRTRLSAREKLEKHRASGLPSWPFHGINWVWRDELEAGLFLCDDIEVHDTWIAIKQCDCKPFDWVADYYQLRRKLKAEGNAIGEKVIKLIVNSLYGKLAQSIGNPPFPTMLWAGKITATARAQLLDAIKTNPYECVMVATDAVYSRTPLHLDFGPELGQWDGPSEYGRSLIIQAGFWRDYEGHIDDKTGERVYPCKTRGMAPRYLETLWPVFADLWGDICNRGTDLAAVVPIRYSDHIGLSRARQYGIERLGQWTDDAYQDLRFRVNKRPHLIGEPVDGWWPSAPTRTDRVGEELTVSPRVGVSMSEPYISEDRSLIDRYFIVEQPDAAEWGYSDD